MKTNVVCLDLSLFNLYVTLSRGTSRDNIRILRDWDSELFLRNHDIDFLAEDRPFIMLNRVTEKWWGQMTASNDSSSVLDTEMEVGGNGTICYKLYRFNV
jgi:hypothetical protein